MSSLGIFFGHIGFTILIVLRYLLVTVGLMLVTISLMTGRFPPPIVEVYKNMKQMPSSLSLVKATQDIVTHQKVKEQLLNNIENPAGLNIGGEDGRGEDGEIEVFQKLKSAEFEIALLKSKLHRAESELESLRATTAAQKNRGKL